jgi:hypothetical protein
MDFVIAVAKRRGAAGAPKSLAEPTARHVC